MADPSRPLRSEAPQARRSITLPVRLSESKIERKESNTPVETLLELPSARIVSFTTPSSAVKSPPNRGVFDADEEIGTLPWSSRLERTIAVGPLRVYRAPGSVAFVNCRTIVKPIFPKSRCWCVDDASSKFVLQMKHPEYWRIEVPVENEVDIQRAKELKEVFSQILLFEKTACPFKRNFTVPLPERPTTPIKKRPWRPVPRTPVEAPIQDAPVNKPEPESSDDYYSANSDENNTSDLERDSDGTDDTNITPRNPFSIAVFRDTTKQEQDSRPEALQASRSVTAPPQLTLITSPPSKARSVSTPPRRQISTNESIRSDFSSSVESFHSVLSWHSPITPLPPSPPQSDPGSPTTYSYPHDHITLPKRAQHTRDDSELTVTTATPTPRTWDLASDASTTAVEEVASPPPPKTPTLIDDIEDNFDEEHFEIATPPTNTKLIRHRPTTSMSRRRALSPLPPAANIFSPTRRRPRHLQTQRHLPTAIIQKTCEILLSPPSHLINLMLDIVARIAAGEWKGIVFGFGEGGEKIVGQWDYDDGEIVEDDWTEDDYGISLSGSHEIRRRRTENVQGGSWEID